MKRKILCLLLALALLAGCASAAERWQEQYDLGMRYLTEGSFDEALAAFTDAIAVDPNRPETYLQRAEAYLALGMVNEALADYETARSLDGGAAAWAGMVEVYIQQEDYETAQRVLDEALALYPEDAALAELQARLEQLMIPEPGSDEFLEAAAAHLDTAAIFTGVSLNGIPASQASMESFLPMLPYYQMGNFTNNPDLGITLSGDYDYFMAHRDNEETYASLMTITVMRYDDTEPRRPAIWLDEGQLAGIQPEDTLATALEKLGFTPEEIQWLAGCTYIGLAEQADGGVRLSVSLPGENANDAQSSCALSIGDQTGVSSTFTFVMNPAERHADTPVVNGDARLIELQVFNPNAA